MKISFYGRLADVLGDEVDLPVPNDCCVADLRTQLASLYPEGASLLENKTVRACVADTIVPDTHRLSPGEHVEFLPPVSGG